MPVYGECCVNSQIATRLVTHNHRPTVRWIDQLFSHADEADDHGENRRGRNGNVERLAEHVVERPEQRGERANRAANHLLNRTRLT